MNISCDVKLKKEKKKKKEIKDKNHVSTQQCRLLLLPPSSEWFFSKIK